MHTTTLAVFPVVTYKYKTSLFKSHGTAFFINNDGVFVTAAHTFRNPTRDFFVIIDGQPLPFTVLYWEYLDHEDQEPPIYKDLLIGKIEGIESPNFYTLTYPAELRLNSALTAPGFHLNDKEATVAPLTTGKLDDLYSDLLANTGSETSATIDPKLDRLELIGIPAVFDHPDFPHIDKTSAVKGQFTNGFTFKTEAHEPHGHSGCPLTREQKVYGMLIGNHGAIGADYILEKLQVPAKAGNNQQTGPQMAVPTGENNKWLHDAAITVHQQLMANDPLYQQYHGDIYYISAADVGELTTPVSTLILRGIGGLQSNYYLNGRNVHLVVINPDCCEYANFTASEIQASIVHELGHVFNTYSHKPLPSVLNSCLNGTPYSVEEVERIKLENRTNDEIYADAYARNQGWAKPLQRGLIKYRDKAGAENVQMIDQRIDKFDSDEVFTGELRTLKTI